MEALSSSPLSAACQLAVLALAAFHSPGVSSATRLAGWVDTRSITSRRYSNGSPSELAGVDPRVEQRGPFAAFRAAGEEPVLPADGDIAHAPFGAVVVDRELAVVGEAHERLPLVVRIPDRVTHFARRKRLYGDLVEQSADLREARPRPFMTQSPRASGPSSATFVCRSIAYMRWIIASLRVAA